MKGFNVLFIEYNQEIKNNIYTLRNNSEFSSHKFFGGLITCAYACYWLVTYVYLFLNHLRMTKFK